MPPKKRSKLTASRRRQSKRLRPSDLTETTTEAALNIATPAATVRNNTMTVDIQALTASISLAVSQAVKQDWDTAPVDFGALLSISSNTDKYSLSQQPSTSASNKTQLTQFNPPGKAFNTFVAIY